MVALIYALANVDPSVLAERMRFSGAGDGAPGDGGASAAPSSSVPPCISACYASAGRVELCGG